MEHKLSSLLPPTPMPLQAAKRSSRPARTDKTASFQDEVVISAHAEKRLQERNIVLEPDDLAKIQVAVKQAEIKGARESLIIYGDLALITSVRNKTIVTALDSAAERIFTNIDSAVLVR